MLWALSVLVGVAAFALRAIHLNRSWDIHVDEILYMRLSQGVADTLQVGIYDVDGPFANGPFYLHPPAFFFLEALYVKLFPPAGDLVQQVYDIRYLNIALAGLTAAVLFGIGRRLAGWPAGIAAAALFALDPFVIRWNSHNLLDTASMAWLALGYYILFSSVGDERRRVPLWRLLAAGVLFGLALLTKDMTAFATVLPFGICFILNWSLPRWQSALASVIPVLVYLPYPLIIYLIGDWSTFANQKLQGVYRLVGLAQTTGFNQKGGPSFLEAILSNLEEFATTYALLGTGALAVCVLFFFFDGAAKRLLLTWTASTYALLAYSIMFGTLEEHFFYLLVVPSMLATAVAATLVLRPGVYDGRTRRALLGTIAVLATIFTGWASYVWGQVHFIPDNGYERVLAYLHEEVPEGTRIGTTTGTAEALTKEYYPGSMEVGSVEELQANDVEYVVTSSLQVEKGYGAASADFYSWVTGRGELVYGFEGRSFGLIGVYRLPDRYTAASDPSVG